MAHRCKRTLVLLLLLGFGYSLTAMAAPSFSDQDLDNGYLNPNDQVAVQKIRIVDGASTISSVWIRNMLEANGTEIKKIVIDDDDDPFTAPIKEYTSLTSLQTGMIFPLGYSVPAGTSYLWIGVEIAAADKVASGDRIQLQVQFFSGTYTSPLLTDGSPETIFKGGFEKIEDDSPSAGYLNPGDTEVPVQKANFTDEDGNSSPVSITEVSVRNMADADDSDVSNVHVDLKVNDVSIYSANKAPSATDWGTGSWLVFDTTGGGTQTPPVVADDGEVTVEVEVTVSGAPEDKREVRTSTRLESNENGETYQQAVEASTTQTIRKQGFEATQDVSADIPSGVLSPEDKLVQKVRLTDDDVNSSSLKIISIWIENTGDATKDDLSEIVIKNATTGTTIHTIPTVTDFKQGHLYTGLDIPVVDDHSITLAIEYVIDTTITDGHTLRPKVYVKANEPSGGPTYNSDEVTYAKSIVLHPYGLESVINVAMSGGTAYSGQRLLAQKIDCQDLDEDTDSVRINPVTVKNVAASPCADAEVTQIEVRTESGALLGETTSIAGLSAGGVTISTLQNNVIPDNGEVVLYIYVTFAGPEAITAGHKLKLQTTIYSEEDGHAGENAATGAVWTLAINHRPTCDFDYEPSTDLTYETEITFTAKDVSDADGDAITSYSWSFSDGGSGTGISVTHAFADGGTVWAKLTVEDARGLTGSTQKTFDVEPPPVVPVAGFDWDPETPATDDEVTFTDTSTTPDGTTITGWEWDFGDDESSTEQNPKHTYTTSGTFTVSLTVTNSDGQSDTVTHGIEVSALKPTGSFDYSPATPDVNQEVTFTDKSAASAPATLASWSWDFGDGSAGSTTQNPTHTYTVVGTYTVSLTVTDSNGETSNAHTEQIVVGPPVLVYSYPNPATTAVTIVYRLPAGATDPILRIYNLAGALVRQETLAAGSSTYVWDLTSDAGAAVSNGLYLCVVTATGVPRSPTFKILITR